MSVAKYLDESELPKSYTTAQATVCPTFVSATGVIAFSE
jgi:hypothetical protein